MASIEVENKLSEIKNIVKNRFPNQTCYFRGEPKFYKLISASLHRNRKIMLPWYNGENPGMKARMVDGIKFDVPQRITILHESNPFRYHAASNFGLEVDIRNPDSLYEMATIAGSFIKEGTKDLSEKEVDLGILQHLGYPTPYLDFTRDCLVSLFFACNKLPDEDGRIIILGDDGNYKFHDMTQARFSIAKERANAQESVMLQKLELKETEDNYKIYRIPRDLKPKISAYLEDRNINEASLFPDSWSYEKEYKPYEKFYRGVQAEVGGNALDAIGLYTEAIDLNPDFIAAYKRRARISYYMGDLRKAQWDAKSACNLEKDHGFYHLNKEDEIIGFHLFVDEHNAGCMHRILAEIYKYYGDKINSQKYMRKAEYIRHRYSRREENENRKNHKRG